MFKIFKTESNKKSLDSIGIRSYEPSAYKSSTLAHVLIYIVSNYLNNL